MTVTFLHRVQIFLLSYLLTYHFSSLKMPELSINWCSKQITANGLLWPHLNYIQRSPWNIIRRKGGKVTPVCESTFVFTQHSYSQKIHRESYNSSKASHLFPCLGAVGLASTVDGSLIFTEVDQRDCKTSEVGHVVVQQLSSIVHFVVKTPVGHLQKYTDHYNTLHYITVIHVFKEKTSITLQELNAIEKMSFQLTSENW